MTDVGMGKLGYQMVSLHWNSDQVAKNLELCSRGIISLLGGSDFKYTVNDTANLV